MNQQEKLQLNDDLVGTAYAVGSNLPDAALTIMVKQLSKYTYPQVKAALNRCTLEVTNRLPLAEIIKRIDDGRPSPEKAWSEVQHLGESDSKMLTLEQNKAFCMVSTSLIDGDTSAKIAARQTFMEVYKQEVAKNRTEGLPVQYFLAVGDDAQGRQEAILLAVQEGKLLQDKAIGMFPQFEDELLGLPTVERIPLLIDSLNSVVESSQLPNEVKSNG